MTRARYLVRKYPVHLKHFAECCCAAVHTQPEEHNEYTEHTAVNSTAVYSSS